MRIITTPINNCIICNSNKRKLKTIPAKLVYNTFIHDKLIIPRTSKLCEHICYKIYEDELTIPLQSLYHRDIIKYSPKSHNISAKYMTELSNYMHCKMKLIHKCNVAETADHI